jgi:Asp-tRNA(Asn)/Glu-tRNA(Gln) amidotransferase A subunit family amidase
MSELHDLTALEQGGAIRAGEVSPVELVEHYLARIERLSDTVGVGHNVVEASWEALRDAVTFGLRRQAQSRVSSAHA